MHISDTANTAALELTARCLISLSFDNKLLVFIWIKCSPRRWNTSGSFHVSSEPSSEQRYLLRGTIKHIYGTHFLQAASIAHQGNVRVTPHSQIIPFWCDMSTIYVNKYISQQLQATALALALTTFPQLGQYPPRLTFARTLVNVSWKSMPPVSACCLPLALLALPERLHWRSLVINC